MGAKRKSWTQKWAEAKAKPELPKVFNCEKSGQRIVVPSPAEIEEIVRQVPGGQVITMAEIASKLTRKHGTDMCCPMTTGIFAWLMAYAACEEQGLDVSCGQSAKRGANPRTAGVPWWRVLKTKGELNPKYPGAPDLQKALLESEGTTVEKRGKKLFVVGVG